MLAALMQGQGTEIVGVFAEISALIGANLLPLKVFHHRMKQFSDGRTATILYTLFIAVWLPISLYLLSILPNAQTTSDELGFLMYVTTRVLLIVLPATLGSALIVLITSKVGLGLKHSGNEG
jgi:hypothetical protein